VHVLVQIFQSGADKDFDDDLTELIDSFLVTLLKLNKLFLLQRRQISVKIEHGRKQRCHSVKIVEAQVVVNCHQVPDLLAKKRERFRKFWCAQIFCDVELIEITSLIWGFRLHKVVGYSARNRILVLLQVKNLNNLRLDKFHLEKHFQEALKV
jgi:hypothetical protein